MKDTPTVYRYGEDDRLTWTDFMETTRPAQSTTNTAPCLGTATFSCGKVSKNTKKPTDSPKETWLPTRDVTNTALSYSDLWDAGAHQLGLNPQYCGTLRFRDNTRCRPGTRDEEMKRTASFRYFSLFAAKKHKKRLLWINHAKTIPQIKGNQGLRDQGSRQDIMGTSIIYEDLDSILHARTYRPETAHPNHHH